VDHDEIAVSHAQLAEVGHELLRDEGSIRHRRQSALPPAMSRRDCVTIDGVDVRRVPVALG
jgi:hypothetical protein